MKRFSAQSVQEAISNAAIYFGCQKEEIEYEIAIEPSRGFLGIGRKDAVIVARKRERAKESENNLEAQEDLFIQPQEDYLMNKSCYTQRGACTQIEENFFQERLTPRELCEEIAQEVDKLFALLPYNINQVKVEMETEDIISIEFSGEDCGLLIGEKGYRYSSIYYLLAIWLKKEYGMGLRLEIADFLKNKERRIEEYLEENYHQIISRTFFQSRTFDPLTASIALRRFREAIPDKYIIIKQVSEIESVISVNEFRTK